MSFWRHEEIYRSDVGLGEARNGNGCRRSPHSSAAMSFQSAIPQQVALQQCLPLLHRLQTILNNQCCRTMILQRTATTPLTPCLSSRVHSKASVPPLLPTDVGEAEEVERLRFPFSALLPVFGCEWSELQQPRFLVMHPPPPVARPCSGTSQVLLVCPTSRVRSSSACVLRLPDASPDIF